MKHAYSLIVSNIGETLQTSNGFVALCEYRRAIADSKAAHGRASGETVTLMRDGEPWREYVPPVALRAVLTLLTGQRNGRTVPRVARGSLDAKSSRGRCRQANGLIN